MSEEKKRIDEKMREQLRKPFPPEAVTQHPTKTFLSTIKAIYVTERLNDVFGVGRWNLVHKVIMADDSYVLVGGTIRLLDYEALVPYQYGGHVNGGKNTEHADAYKSAVTDLMSKCASYLEIGIDVFKGKTTHKSTQKKESSGNGFITEAQAKRMFAIANDRGISNDDVKNILINRGIEHSREIKKDDYEDIIMAIEEFATHKENATA